MRTRIKLCGFQTEDTVRAATRAGADAIGFVFYPPSPRNVDVVRAGQLARCLGAWQTPVALFVNPQLELVQSVIAEIPNVLLQFHGDESPEFCESFQRPFMKAVRMKPGVDLIAESVKFYSAQAILVDSWSEAYGGTGHTFDWSLLPKAGELKQALVLSGGLDECNVAQAIAGLQPYGVDVSSGIESARGVKCIEKIEKFCMAVQKADAGLL
ncbi:phosphoribosylanthranilate isomerase [Limnobacter thiooxidans]|uniref:N-(5'-phosphoribosyl)anthranilate isomerase n=1 Tax=Limnobacter thiooxidans TaxID=131080 RepID=A0AA86JFE5_9BURK|nr:phosphoribosylanthranilate isomerase [Limnobacter thiooxidans]BET25956.1 phosphoribosylanthranilate isomerase [Limnobacter thiooxidans]